MRDAAVGRLQLHEHLDAICRMTHQLARDCAESASRVELGAKFCVCPTGHATMHGHDNAKRATKNTRVTNIVALLAARTDIRPQWVRLNARGNEKHHMHTTEASCFVSHHSRMSRYCKCVAVSGLSGGRSIHPATHLGVPQIELRRSDGDSPSIHRAGLRGI